MIKLDKRNTQVGISLARLPSNSDIEKAITTMNIDIITKKNLDNMNKSKLFINNYKILHLT